MNQPTMWDEQAPVTDQQWAYLGVRRYAFELFIEGDPQGKGSVMALPVKRKGGKWGARVVMKGSKAKRAWDQAIKDRARAYVRELGVPDDQPLFGEHCPVRLEAIFWMPRPQRIQVGGQNGRKHPGAGTLPSVIPDLDKLLRMLKDGLKGAAYHDDAQVVTVDVKKRYTRPGAEGLQALLTSPTPGVIVRVTEETDHDE